MAPDAERPYGAMYRGFTSRAAKRERDGSPPEFVASAVLHALRDRSPRRRYVIGKGARLLATLPRIMPAALLDRVRMRIFGIPTPLPDAARS